MQIEQLLSIHSQVVLQPQLLIASCTGIGVVGLAYKPGWLRQHAAQQQLSPYL